MALNKVIPVDGLC